MKRVLVDRHHADLFYGLQVLFEDRLDMMVFTPIGQEWWEEGYWRFGEGYGDDRLAQQFLGAQPVVDSHHPNRPIHFTTLGLARQAKWDYVVATVQDNQKGFRRFADEVGARYVLQVGNTRQSVDWELDPLALVSSEVPIKGRGILYHQELAEDFHYRPLMDPTVVRSFVNCFPSTPCWAPFSEISEQLPGFLFRAHGIDGPAGNIETVSEIADLMSQSGWGWHDKVQGDGFGHVIHGWAAIGRPLIGHAAHYRGLMAEGFWEDGVTCIDLDRYTVGEASLLIKDISADRTRHEAMCAEIRRRFERIDYDAEAETIRRFLA